MEIRFPGGGQGGTSPSFAKAAIWDSKELPNSSIIGVTFCLAQRRDVLGTVASWFLATHYRE